MNEMIYELTNGQKVTLGLNFKKLAELEASGYEKEVKAFYELIMNGCKGFSDWELSLWMLYLCGKREVELTRDEFDVLVGCDFKMFTAVTGKLIFGSKGTDQKNENSSEVSKKSQKRK